MDKKNLSLAETLNQIADLEKKITKLIQEDDQLVSGHRFRGDSVDQMNCNRKLYFIGTYHAMQDAIGEMVEGYDFIEEDVVEVCDLNDSNHEAIQAMKGSILLHAEIRQTKRMIKALEAYSRTFEEEDFRRIRKENSLKLLKQLGLG